MNAKMMVNGNSGRTATMFVISLVIVLLAVSAAVAIMRLGGAVRDAGQAMDVQRSTAVTIENDGYSTYTDRYYEAAAAREAAIAAEADDDYAFYTERYYEAAAAREAAIAAEAEDDYAFYTERYYEAAAAREAATSATR